MLRGGVEGTTVMADRFGGFRGWGLVVTSSGGSVSRYSHGHRQWRDRKCSDNPQHNECNELLRAKGSLHI